MLAGVGGIGTGMFFALEGDETLGRNESRPGRLLDVRDYCKLHIIAHYVSVLLGAEASGSPFRVLPIGKVGNDETGRRLAKEMADAGMDTNFIEAVRDRPTLLSVCFQYPDGSGGNITTSDGASSALSGADIDRAKSVFEANAGHWMALAVPEVPLEARRRLLEVATEYGAFRAAAFTSAEISAAREMGMFAMTDLVSLNEDEGQALTGREFDPAAPEAFLGECQAALARENGGMRIVLSAGRHGAYGFEGGRWEWTPAAQIEVKSTAGAGDALLGGVLAGLAAGWPLVSTGEPRKAITDRALSSALDYAVLLAAFKCTSPHTINFAADVDHLMTFAARLRVRIAPQFARAWQAS